MEKLYYNWEEVEELVDLLAQQIIKSGNILIVDDICDSGETFKEFFLEYPHSIFACLHFKPHTSCFKPEFSSNKFLSDAWIVYPWERVDSKTIQDYKILS